MFFQEFQPPPNLAPYVECFWCLETTFSETINDFVLPDGYTELIVHYQLKPGQGWAEASPYGTVFAGQISQSLELEFEAGLGMVAVRFKPQGAFYFLKDNLSQATDQQLDMLDWDPNLVGVLEERVLKARHRHQRLQILCEFVIQHLQVECLDVEVVGLVSFFERHQGNTVVADVIKNFGLSQRQLERRFKEVVGLTMRSFNQIQRFKKAVLLLHESPFPDFTQVALECGYCDQAHMNRDFRKFVSMSPSQYLKNPSDIENIYLPQENVEKIQYASPGLP